MWTSPLTDDGLAELAPKVRQWGFDVIELPVEQPGDWDPHRAADLLAALDLTATIVLAMRPGRELVDADTVAETQDYLRHAAGAAMPYLRGLLGTTPPPAASSRIPTPISQDPAHEIADPAREFGLPARMAPPPARGFGGAPRDGAQSLPTAGCAERR